MLSMISISKDLPYVFFCALVIVASVYAVDVAGAGADAFDVAGAVVHVDSTAVAGVGILGPLAAPADS